MPTKEELLAYKKNNEMCKHINAKTLKFLSLDGLYKALIDEQRNEKYPQFSDHYFTGEYPVKPYDKIVELRLNNFHYLAVSQIISLKLLIYFCCLDK